MEIQLQELIDQIKKDGLEVAETEAEALLNEAKAQAEKIVSDAKMQAEKILSDAERENQRVVKSGEEAIKQAGRNLLISFRESVTKEVDAILNENVKAVYSSESLAQLVIKVVKCWAEKPDVDDISVVLNDEDLKKHDDFLENKIKSAIWNN